MTRYLVTWREKGQVKRTGFAFLQGAAVHLQWLVNEEYNDGSGRGISRACLVFLGPDGERGKGFFAPDYDEKKIEKKPLDSLSLV